MSSSNVHSSSPDSYIVAFPYKKEVSQSGKPLSADVLDTEPLIIHKDILSVQTNKSKGGVGSWGVELGSSKNYKALLHTGCWVMIYINDTPYEKLEGGAGKDSGLKMFGQIKSLRVVESTDGSGHRTIRYSISGDDFQSLFNSNIYVNNFMSKRADGGKNSDSIILFKSPNTTAFWKPSEYATNIFKSIKGIDVEKSGTSLSAVNNGTLGGVLAVPPKVMSQFNKSGNKFFSLLAYGIQPSMVGKIPPQPDLGQVFTLWSLLVANSHSILNEVYADLILTNKGFLPAFVFRAIPFSSNSQCSSLVYPEPKTRDGTNCILSEKKGVGLYISKEIEENEIFTLNYGKHDAERFNFFLISSPVLLEKQTKLASQHMIKAAGGGMDNVTNKDDIVRNGLRPYISASEYAQSDIKLLTEINEIIKDMWGPAHLFENGQVTIVGSHKHIPVGTNIKFKARGWVAHVENVTHSYHVEGDGSKGFYTTISFVRLQNEKGEPIDLVDKSEQRDFDRGVTHSEGDNE